MQRSWTMNPQKTANLPFNKFLIEFVSCWFDCVHFLFRLCFACNRASFCNRSSYCFHWLARAKRLFIASEEISEVDFSSCKCKFSRRSKIRFVTRVAFERYAISK